MVKAVGGGSGAVATSAHSGCQRFRGTDPIITGLTRRNLARLLGNPDISGHIPLARWQRARTFERLLQKEIFASQVATATAGALMAPRPTGVLVVDGEHSTLTTKIAIASAILAARKNVATLIHTPAVPTPGFSEIEATNVLPDFIVVVPGASDDAKPQLVIGDAKDYERVRSRIDDTRMLKGFLQVAFGAEAFASWAILPADIDVSDIGVLAVPKNVHLQPMVVPENISDHREEVRMRLEQRIRDVELHKWLGENEAAAFTSHLQANFDPAGCQSCPLFNHCRTELRNSTDPLDLLVEIGVPRNSRRLVKGLIDGTGEVPSRATSGLIARVQNTLKGQVSRTGQNRLDPAGKVATIDLAVIKSDGAALGVHGLSTRIHAPSGPTAWRTMVFDKPLADQSRRAVMQHIGEDIANVLAFAIGDEGLEAPIHLVTPDTATADLLASIADSLAGSEISRMRWKQDRAQNREPLTIDGKVAVIPAPLTAAERLAVSFLLEDDRARGFNVRTTTYDLRTALKDLFITGGPAVNDGRLDYLEAWSQTGPHAQVDFRVLSDAIEAKPHTPGARMTSAMSDRVNNELEKSRTDLVATKAYAALVREELRYKTELMERVLSRLSSAPDSKLRDQISKVEREAQIIWLRRYSLRAFDLIRFGLTNRFWRNSLVEVVQQDQKFLNQIKAVTNPTWAEEQAKSAGMKELAFGVITKVNPLTIRTASRAFTPETSAVILHRNYDSTFENSNTAVKFYKGHLKLQGMPTTKTETLLSVDDRLDLAFDTTFSTLAIGDEVVLARLSWFDPDLKDVKINRPKIDAQQSPKASCDENAFSLNPAEHRWCCRPHELQEKETADWIASRRSSGEFNPQAWPPVLDQERFDQLAAGEPVDEDIEISLEQAPDDLELDALD